MKKRKSQNSPTISSSTIPLPPQQQEREVERTFDVINGNNHYEHDDEDENEREITTHVFRDPSLFLSAVESELSLRPMQSNIVYAHAHKLRQHQHQHQHQEHQDHDEASGGAGKRVQPGQLWIALYSTPRHPPPKPLHNHHPSTITTTNNRSQRNTSIITTTAAAVAAATASTSTGNGTTTTTTTTTTTSIRRVVRPRLEFVLSCTTGPLGDYPIFIYNARPPTPQTHHHHHTNPNSKQHHKQQPSSSSSSSFLQSRMDALATRLLPLVPPSRVFSVFAPYNVTLAFAAAWTQQTGIEIVRGPPWYSATSSFCTLETFKGGAMSMSMVRLSKLADAFSPPATTTTTTTTTTTIATTTTGDMEGEVATGVNPSSEALFVDEGCWYEHTMREEEQENDKDESDRDEGKKKMFTTLLCHEIRRATMDDLDECATLCQEFAELSPPFVLTAERARMEAEELIRCGLLWVYGLSPFLRSTTTTSSSSSTAKEEEGGEKTKVATLVAVTRSTPTVSAITKVYTTDRYRRRGYADRLVAHVTKYLLEEEKKEAVVLFVGHTLDAVRVYRRIGFVGLDTLRDGSRTGAGMEVGVRTKTVMKAAEVEDWLELGFEGGELGHCKYNVHEENRMRHTTTNNNIDNDNSKHNDIQDDDIENSN
ncbi:hypothetical protein FRC17_010319 [Serendipita sp. 399]|nr:hypothetical protein FRC17_010319 [Serendipita sp. 399]